MPFRPLQLVQATLALCLVLWLVRYTTPTQPPSPPPPHQHPHPHLYSQLHPEPNIHPDASSTAAAAATDLLIPQTIHHLLLSMPNHPVSAFRPSQHTISWQQSGWKIEYWTEAACAQLAHTADPAGRYAAALAGFPSAVLKSDFCRYLILSARGGVYNDLDVRLMQPLPWGVMLGDESGKGDGAPAAIIGLEGDAATRGLPRSPQFVQWTMVAAPGHPIFEAVLRKIVDRTEAYLRLLGEAEGSGTAVEPPDVMDWTGPSVWSEAVLEYLEVGEGMLETLRDLQETVRIKDVVVLPKRGFAVTQGEDHRSSEVLVKHYFSGTWKTGCRAVWRWIGRC